MSRKNKKEENLDTQTSFADMNVEGFAWYSPEDKSGKKEQKVKRDVGRKQYWQIVRNAFIQILPAVFIFFVSMAIVGILLYLWLK